MPGGLDTGLPVTHYLAKSIAWNTPGLQTGLVLGELSAGSMLITPPQFNATQNFNSGCLLVFSNNPDLSSPFAQIDVSSPGFGTATLLAGVSSYFRSGRVYIGVPVASPFGSGIVLLRFIPRTG